MILRKHFPPTIAPFRSAEAAKDVGGEGETLAGLAYLQFFLGDTQKALDNAATALALSQAAGNRRGEARARSVMGDAYYSLGDMSKAREIQEQALSLWRALDDARGEAQSLVLGRVTSIRCSARPKRLSTRIIERSRYGGR